MFRPEWCILGLLLPQNTNRKPCAGSGTCGQIGNDAIATSISMWLQHKYAANRTTVGVGHIILQRNNCLQLQLYNRFTAFLDFVQDYPGELVPER